VEKPIFGPPSKTNTGMALAALRAGMPIKNYDASTAAFVQHTL